MEKYLVKTVNNIEADASGNVNINSQTPWTSNINAAGYTLFGNSISGGTLTLSSTSHATKGKILFGNSAYDEVNNRLAIGTTSFNYDSQKGYFYGSDGTGAGVALTVRNADLSALSFAVYEMHVGAGNEGGKFFASRATNNTVGIVNGITFRADTNQDLGMSILGYAGARMHVQGTTGDVGIRTFNTTLGYLSYLADLTVGSGNTSQPPTVGALRPTMRVIGNTQVSGTDISILRLVRETAAGLYYNQAAEWKMKSYGASGAPYLPKTQVTFSLKSTAAFAETCDVDVMTWMDNGNIGAYSVLVPTARFHLPAGTATAETAPLKLTSGTNLTTPEDGAFEFDGTNLYFTVGGVRKTVTLV